MPQCPLYSIRFKNNYKFYLHNNHKRTHTNSQYMSLTLIYIWIILLLGGLLLCLN
nr:MAG TPA: hypothetical protein [Caudoviricetes sp.]